MPFRGASSWSHKVTARNWDWVGRAWSAELMADSQGPEVATLAHPREQPVEPGQGRPLQADPSPGAGASEGSQGKDSPTSHDSEGHGREPPWATPDAQSVCLSMRVRACGALWCLWAVRAVLRVQGSRVYLGGCVCSRVWVCAHTHVYTQ